MLAAAPADAVGCSLIGVLVADITKGSSDRGLDEVDDISDELESVRRGFPGRCRMVEKNDGLNDLPKLAITLGLLRSLAG